ncbi:MAG: GAF and ANTAR domain-containing protein [Desulfobacterales bacterium]|nr:GAF and ANTAR domain-containing protein [Desulfobacterales bacterium]
MKEFRSETYDNYIKALTDISRAITSDQYLEDILKLIVMVTAKVTDVEICSLWLVDETESPKKIRLKATQAIDPDYVKDRSLTMEEGVVGFVATQSQPLIVADVLKEPRFKEKDMAKNLGLVSMLGVPLQVGDGKVIGVLNCFTAKAHEFSGTEVNLITAVANQAAVAILNTELMVKTKVIREELETRKLVERAKEVLMRRRNMDADEAYRWIQKRSMDSRKSMHRIADAVLLSEELE